MQRVTFRSVFANREFRALWAAEALSQLGDQLARVALAVLVYQRTNSAALTGLTFALTYLPALVGGTLLGSLGDRFSRREVMIVADLVRVVLVGLMAIPGTPLWLLFVLVAAATTANGPFKAAQQALLPDVLPGETFAVGMAARNISTQTMVLAGFGGGGFLVSAVDPSLGLALNALTFLVSAVIIRAGVQARPPVAAMKRGFFSATAAGVKVIWTSPGLPSLIGLCWLAGFYVVPEALAAPYADRLGVGAIGVGLLMACEPLGGVIGGVLFTWFSEDTRARIVGLLGIVTGLPLAVCVLHPSLIASMGLFALSGVAATALNIQTATMITRGLPQEQRAQGAGLISTGLITVQGLGALIAGVVAEEFGPAPTIALAGIAGALVAVPLARGWSRVRNAAGQSQ